MEPKIIREIGNLSELETSDKSNLVNAINDSMKITDTVAGVKFRWGVENGLLYIEEVG